MANIQINDKLDFVEITTDGISKYIQKNTIVRVESLLGTKLRIIDNSGLNEYNYSEITSPVTSQLSELVDIVTGMIKKKATYGAAISGLTVAPAATDVFTISGSANKKIKIVSFTISGLRSTAANISVHLVKRSTLNSGASISLTNVPFDSSDSSSDATVVYYTTNPILGTLVGIIAASKLFMPATTTAFNMPLKFNFSETDKQPLLLTSNESISINLNGATIAGSNFDIFVQWVEE